MFSSHHHHFLFRINGAATRFFKYPNCPPRQRQGESVNILLTDGLCLDACREDDFPIFAAHARNLFCFRLMLAVRDVSALSMFSAIYLMQAGISAASPR